MSKEVGEVLRDAQRQQVALLLLMGNTEAEISEKMSIAKVTVGRIKAEPEFIALLEDITRKKVGMLLQKWLNKLETVETHAWNAFMHQLKDKKSLDAVKLFMEMIGFSKKQEGKTEDGKIVIIMPDAKVEKDLGNATIVTE